MTALKGIGRWAAEIYLMFCHGRPDRWPAHDIALQNAVYRAFDLNARPGPCALDDIAETWRPWHSAAAQLLWAYLTATRAKAA